MSGEHDGGEALAWGAPERVGWFRYYFDDERWEWSPQVAKMHGYSPGAVKPTTDLVLSHKHPDDYRQIADTLALIRQTRQAFSSRHRIRDTNGSVHHVVVVTRCATATATSSAHTASTSTSRRPSGRARTT